MRENVQLSERFDICANLPAGAAYEYDREGIDFDLGKLSYNGDVAQVYIGHQPDFPGKDWARRLPEEFTYLENSGQKWLLGRGRRDRTGPLFVMLTSKAGATFSSLVAKEGFIVQCRR